MRYLLIFFFAGLISSACAQKMYETGEWCAHSKNLFQPAAPLPNDTRSDSIDLTHAWITLDLTQVSSQKISGNCKWVFTPIVDQIAEIQFDLLALTVDSVIFNHLQVPFQRQGEKVVIPFSAPLSQGSIYDITIYYQGTPQKDASDWGGFYFSGNYAFNLGVGFAADPHVFGRAWFPCFDNFEERSTYTFDMYTTPAQPAYCNGYLLTDETTPDNKRRRLWLMNQSIPSYLACVAIGPYTSFTRTYQGVNNPIPVEIAAAAADTNKVRTTFIHLPDAIKAYEHWFGPYKWHKIGYSLVPFNSGAMEHATNVAIGRTFINGSLNYETLWAHELSHHWWGDLATCTTAEDMWLNEGWASFSEHLFTEWVYGRAAYIAAVKSNFLNVLQNAHVGEGGYRAVSGVPHNLTYGTHVYNKGAVVAHNLRAYMGDSLFRIGIRSALDQTNFTDWSSADFRDKLELATGLDLHPFFNDWVFNGGYPDFVIDSIHTSATGQQNLQVKVFLKQTRRGTPAFHQSVPLELTAVDQNGQKMNFLTTISGEYGS
ncbi:MAG: M1 family metallopeptidase, partial [Saprospiraceae bacterium]|nr:M1 family metallopeptidase [Saprospiraceae bacterium]